MLQMISLAGVFAALVLLIYLSFRGWPVVLVSLLCSLLVLITSAAGIWDGFSAAYGTGLGNYIGSYFIMMVMGALFGRIITQSGCAQKVAVTCIDIFGKGKADWVVVITGIILSYAGINVLVILFVMYPIVLFLSKVNNMPKQILVTCYSIGTGTFMVTCAPGTPSVPNLAASKTFGTSSYAAPVFSLIICAVMLTLSMLYVNFLKRRAVKKNEGFVPGPRDAEVILEEEGLPGAGTAFLPLITAVVLMLVLNQFMPSLASVCVALPIASCMCVLTNREKFPDWKKTVKDGMEEAYSPVIATAAIVGFGAVIQSTDAFTMFVDFCTNFPLGNYANAALSSNLIAGICGSGSGGYVIWLNTMAENFVKSGVNVELLHRISCIACGIFDTLPHSGAVVALLTISQLNHRNHYVNLFVVSVLIPLIGCLVGLCLIPFFA